jgi:lipopolysaccharide export system permease protein
MTAIKTGGVSLFRTTAPILIVSLLVSGFVFLLGEFVVSPSLNRLDYVYEVKIKGENSSEYQQKNIWVKTGRNQIWSISKFIPRKMKMEDVVVFSLNGDNSLRMRVDAATVLKEDGKWKFRSAFVRTFSGGRITSTQVFDDVTLPLNIDLTDLKTDFSRPERMSFRELREKVRKRRSVGLQSNAMATDMHSKLSYPLSSLVMALLGIPFSLGWERGGKLAWGIVLGITISALYWIMFFVGVSLGHSGLLPPLAAAWGANILLSLAGAYMMLGVG